MSLENIITVIVTFLITFTIAYCMYKFIYQPQYDLVVAETAEGINAWDKKYTSVVAENETWGKKYASVVAEKGDIEKKYADLSQIVPNPTKVDRYWGCILAADTPVGYKWATTDKIVGPLLVAAKMSLQSQLNIVRDNYPTAKYVAVTQSYTSAIDSLYILWGTDPPIEPKINGQNRRCLLAAKDGYVGCKGDTPILGCLGDVTLSGNTWVIYKIRD